MSKAAVLNFPEPKAARLYYFDKKTNKRKRLSDNIFRDLQYVTRPDDRKKRISLKARNLLTNLLQMILKNPHKEEFVDHAFLSQITEVSSSKQNARLLDQISDIIDSTYHSYINFHGKNKTYGYVIKLTEDGYERAKNPVAFYSDLDRQKCLVESTKMSTRVDKNVQIYKEEENPKEEINSSYAREFISEKEKIYKKEKVKNELHATFAPCFPSEQEQVAYKVLNEPTKQEDISEMNLEELPKLTEKEERTILLSHALQQTFGEQRSGEIRNDYKFVEITPQKVCIQTKEMRLNDIEKAKIRKAIQSVYGEDVTIAMQVLAPPLAEPMRQSNQADKSNLLAFKSKLHTQEMQQIFNNPVVKVIETHNKIIVDAVAFLIEQMTLPGNIDNLEEAVLATGLTLELHKKNTQQQPIILTPEKILKDREWLENHYSRENMGNYKGGVNGRLN